MLHLQILSPLNIQEMACPTCDNVANPIGGRCPKIFTLPERIYVTRYHYSGYVKFFADLNTFKATLEVPGLSNLEIREI